LEAAYAYLLDFVASTAINQALDGYLLRAKQQFIRRGMATEIFYPLVGQLVLHLIVKIARNVEDLAVAMKVLLNV
jgi:hypothetical protein